jgi:hypothetical protein
MMEARAQNLLAALKGITATLPGANGVSFHVHTAWCYVLVWCVSDEAVQVIGADLGLGPVEVRTIPGRWWLRTHAEEAGARVEVVGPHHIGPATPDGSPEQSDPTARRENGSGS